MQIGFIVAVELIYVILAAVLSLRVMNLVQLEGYRVVNSKKMKNIRYKLYGSAICITLCNGIFSYLAVKLNNYYLQLIIQGLYVVALLVSLTDERDKCAHQPLVFTARAKRLMASFVSLNIVLILLLGLLGHLICPCGVNLTFIFIPIVFTLLPEAVSLAILVNKPLEKSIAKRYIKKCTIKIAEKQLIKIGITGSFAKTTTKNILTTLLNQKYNAYCTPSNYNTPLGICKAVNNLPEDCEIFIAEMGARRVGDIKELCDIVKPTYGIITGVGSQHLGVFKSRDNIYNAKKELADFVRNVGGEMVFNAANEYTRKMYEEYGGDKKTAISSSEYLPKSSEKNIWIEKVECNSRGLQFELHIGSESSKCNCKLIGEHNLDNILICVQMAVNLGLNIVQIAKGISEIAPVEHRLQTIELPSGITIIDDSYNSNESGAKLALQALNMFEGRKVVATQGIVEMGEEQKRVNFELGENIAAVADIAILIGVNSDDIRLGLLSEGYCDKNIYVVEHLDNAKELFGAMLKKGDVLLLQNDLPDNY